MENEQRDDDNDNSNCAGDYSYSDDVKLVNNESYNNLFFSVLSYRPVHTDTLTMLLVGSMTFMKVSAVL